jgi:chaperonin GroES
MGAEAVGGCEMSDAVHYAPRGDRVVVKRLPRTESEAGQLSIPDSQKPPINEGIVIAVGPGARNRVTGQIDPIDLQPGDQVAWVDYAGSEDPETGHLMLMESEIWGVVKNG